MERFALWTHTWQVPFLRFDPSTYAPDLRRLTRPHDVFGRRVGSPALLHRAAERGIRVLAITDHDTLAGWDAAQDAAAGSSVDVIPGVELSVTVGEQEVHLLGYGFDPSHAGLRAHLDWFVEARRQRARQMVENLRALGVDVTLEDVQHAASGAEALGRPHVAMALTAAGHVDSYQDAFEQYLAHDGPAFAAKPSVPARDALDLLHDAGGIGVLAHPGHWTSGRLLHQLDRAGLDGIEVWHPSHDASLVAYYERLARDYDLVATGGSDYHGHRPNDDEHFGTQGLTRPAWQRIRDAVHNTGTAR